jgi:hypothetical protein
MFKAAGIRLKFSERQKTCQMAGFVFTPLFMHDHQLLIHKLFNPRSELAAEPGA